VTLLLRLVAMLSVQHVVYLAVYSLKFNKELQRMKSIITKVSAVIVLGLSLASCDTMASVLVLNLF